MADDVTLNAGTGGATLAADDIGGVHHQRVKVQYGVDGAATDVSDTNPLPVDDAGGSLTVDNDGTFAVQAAQSGTWNVTDISGTVSLPTGAATAANQTTIIGHVDGLEGLLTTIDADTGTLAGTVVGTEVQVDVVAALPAGDNNIGNVDIASALPAGDNNIGNVDLASAIPAGTNNIGDVDVLSLPALPAGTNNIGDVDVASIAAGTNLIGNVGLGVRTSGGVTPYQNLDVDESEDEVKGSAGQVYFIHAMNLANAKRYLKFYNDTAANVSVGSTTPVLTFTLPTQGDTNGAGFTLAIPNGIAFSAAITIAATTGFAVADTGAPGANEIIVNLGYA